MRLIILGGTVFLGRYLVEAAQARGHQVTLFNRGKSNPDLFPEVEQLHGDRKLDLSPLTGRTWDAVIDTCGYVPRVVRMSAEALAGSVGHYTFISSISAYASVAQPGLDESGEVARMTDATLEEVTGETYGPLKVLCEEAVTEVFGDQPPSPNFQPSAKPPAQGALIIRPGLIVGPHDISDRFTYWPHRIAEGGEVLAPGDPVAPIQIIDVRDLAEWTVRLVEEGAGGSYNAVGPETPLTMCGILECCREVAGSDARFTWVPDAFLVEREVQPWMGLPLWIPDDPDSRGFNQVNVAKAIASGLTFRPLADTVRDTLSWDQTRSADHPWRAGIPREREAELLAAWRETAISE